MKPEIKAEELVQKYFDLTDHMTWEEAKECAIICCDEIITNYVHADSFDWKFWTEVKSEIEKL